MLIGRIQPILRVPQYHRPSTISTSTYHEAAADVTVYHIDCSIVGDILTLSVRTVVPLILWTVTRKYYWLGAKNLFVLKDVIVVQEPTNCKIKYVFMLTVVIYTFCTLTLDNNYL